MVGDVDEFAFWRLARAMLAAEELPPAAGMPGQAVPAFMELFQPAEVLLAAERRRTELRGRVARDRRARRVVVNHQVLTGAHHEAFS